jgi:hypothetical protein
LQNKATVKNYNFNVNYFYLLLIMSEGKPESISLFSQRDNIHSKEQGLYPNNIVSLEPVRTAVANKVTKTLLLKHMEDALELFDCYRNEDEENYHNKSDLLYLTRNRSTLGFYLPLFASMAYVGLTGHNVLHLNSYIINIQKVFIVGAGTWLAWKLLFNATNSLAFHSLGDDKEIVNAKALLHTNAVKLTNELKYPESDLL